MVGLQAIDETTADAFLPVADTAEVLSMHFDAAYAHVKVRGAGVWGPGGGWGGEAAGRWHRGSMSSSTTTRGGGG